MSLRPPPLPRVLTVNRLERLRDSRWTLITVVECFSDFVLVRTVDSGLDLPMSAEEAQDVESWMLQDDVGTEYIYETSGGGGLGSVGYFAGVASFRPAVPAAASLLYLMPPKMDRSRRAIEVSLEP